MSILLTHPDTEYPLPTYPPRYAYLSASPSKLIYPVAVTVEFSFVPPSIVTFISSPAIPPTIAVPLILALLSVSVIFPVPKTYAEPTVPPT